MTGQKIFEEKKKKKISIIWEFEVFSSIVTLMTRSTKPPFNKSDHHRLLLLPLSLFKFITWPLLRTNAFPSRSKYLRANYFCSKRRGEFFFFGKLGGDGEEFFRLGPLPKKREGFPFPLPPVGREKWGNGAKIGKCPQKKCLGRRRRETEREKGFYSASSKSLSFLRRPTLRPLARLHPFLSPPPNPGNRKIPPFSSPLPAEEKETPLSLFTSHTKSDPIPFFPFRLFLLGKTRDAVFRIWKKKKPPSLPPPPPFVVWR